MSSSLPEIDLPVIDISQFELEPGLNHLQYHDGLAKVREACKEWGFFRLVNHRIADDHLQMVETVTRDLLSLPIEANKRYMTSSPYDSYRHAPPEAPSLESFCIRNLPHSLHEMSQKIWLNEGNPKFCDTMSSYSIFLHDLTRKIAKIIVASLGLAVETFYYSDFEKCIPYMRINSYSSDGKSMGEEVLCAHTDIPCLTLLYQDNVGGLQIRSKEGNWFHVKPQPHSFVVNLGDSLKAWSNGRYRSSEHRVVYEGWRDRISLAFFLEFPEDKNIWAPMELVGKNNPRRYRPFIYSHFKQERRNHVKDEDKATIIDRYAGV